MEAFLKNNPGKYIQLYTDCIPVRGAMKSAIYDLTREELTSFPTTYYDLLAQIEGVDNETLLSKLAQSEDQEGVYHLIEFLFEFEFAFLTENPSQFPKIESKWKHHGVVHDAIVDIDQEIHNMDQILSELDALGCQFLQIRTFSNILSLADLKTILDKACHTSIQSVELILKYDQSYTDKAYSNLMLEHPFISHLNLHSAPQNRDLIVDYDSTDSLNHIVQKVVKFSSLKITSESHCGAINLMNLSTPSVKVFFENKEYNGCLNRKIGVDKFGNIKNCPSMPTAYGNIKTDTLTTALENDTFKKQWAINKDQITTCMDCELRYICSDCRAYTENKSVNNAKPIKCKYNPYIGEWEV